jgi:hypothetical protein
MGTLRDEKYEKLDYLSQLTEIVVSPQNEILGNLPERLKIDFELFSKVKTRAWNLSLGFEVNVTQILIEILSLREREYIEDIRKCFTLEASEDLEVDFDTQKMTGTLVLVKIDNQLDEKKLLEMAIEKAKRHLSYYCWPAKRLREKISTVLDVFETGSGSEWAKTAYGRSGYEGERKICEALTSVILDNKWRIRDTSIIIKMGSWIQGYLKDEDESNTGLVNLIKLKIMVDKDLPIYSIDEVK